MEFNFALTDPNANSLVSLEQAKEYFDTCFQIDDWTNASEDDKMRALIKATDIIDSYRFHHQKLEYKQALKMPTYGSRLFTSVAHSGSKTTVVDTALTDRYLFSDDEFEYGAIRIILGTNLHEIKRITEFDVSTGTVTFDEMPVACDSTTQYELVSPLPRAIVYAVCELALWIMQGGDQEDSDPRVKSYSTKTFSVQYYNNDSEIALPVKVKNYLMPFINRTGRITPEDD